MTEPPALPPPETREEPVAEPPPAPPVAKRSYAPWLTAAGFLVLAAAIVWVWLNPTIPTDGQTSVLAQQLAALELRIARLEQRPAPQMPDLAALSARVTELEQRPPQTTQAGSPPDLAPLTARITELEQRRVPDLAPLETRIAALEARQPADNQLLARADALSARFEAFETGQRAAQTELSRRVEGDEARLTAIERGAGQISALVDRANRIARIQSVQLALDAGHALGEIPGAPPALARFGGVKPPTEASLRQAFPDAARAALAVARPATEGQPFLTRLWAQAQDLVTIRQGDRVLVGDAAAGVLGRAGAALDAGDLAGAIAAVGSLTGPSADAMADWLAQARSLLAARAALAEWAAHT